jgi:hypothetical protein
MTPNGRQEWAMFISASGRRGVGGIDDDAGEEW